MKHTFSRKKPIKFSIVSAPVEGIREFQQNCLKTISDLKNNLKQTDLTEAQKKELIEKIQDERLKIRLNRSYTKILTAKYKGHSISTPFYGNKIEVYKRLSSKLSEIVKQSRKESKLEKPASRQLEQEVYQLFGGVHKDKDSIVNLYKSISKKRIKSYRKPDNTENHVGVELEFFCPHNEAQIGEALIEGKLSRWTRIKTDASIRPDVDSHYGWEVCVVSPESKLDQIVGRTCEILNKMKGKVNASCGLHVHLDMRNRNKEMVYNNLVQCQELLFSLVGAERRSNRYCQKQQTPDWSNANTNHHMGISKFSFEQHRTIEVRIHHATLDYKEIKQWVNLLIRIANYNEYISEKITNLSAFSKWIKSDENMINFINNRMRTFAA